MKNKKLERTIDLHESIDIGSGKVDRENNIIRDVLLVGEGKASNPIKVRGVNYRYNYTNKVLSESTGKYGGSPVFIDHLKEGDQSRSLAARFGSISNQKFVADQGVRGDISYNPSHTLAEQILWMAENQPQNLGCSHVASCKLAFNNGQLNLTEIKAVKSVDLVSSGATTKTLFESDLDLDENEGIPNEKETEMEMKDITVSMIESEREDIVSSITAKSEDAHKAEVKNLKEQLDEAQVKLELIEKKEMVNKLIAEAKLPKVVITDIFKNTMMEAKDEDAVKALIEDRALLGAISNKPTSVVSIFHEGEKEDQAINIKNFVKKVRG